MVRPIRSIVKKLSSEPEKRVCSRHGIELELGQICPECIRIHQERAEKVQEEQRLEQEKRAKQRADHPEPYLARIGVGKRHISCSFENYKGADKIKAVCMGIMQNPCDLILCGPAGSGKTHLAVAILREWVRSQKITLSLMGGNGIFVTVPDLLLEIREAFGDKSDKSEADIVKKYATVDYLVLDDLGAEKTTEWSITTLYTIIDQRYRQELPTIVTTNLTIDEIGTQISERIASRLASGKVIKINAPDYRRKR